MPQLRKNQEFFVEAMDVSGREIREIILAQHQDDAIAKMRQKGYFVTKVALNKNPKAPVPILVGSVSLPLKKKPIDPIKPLDANAMGKKVLWDTLVAPISIFPVMLGATASMLGWAVSCSAMIAIGILSVLFGMGVAATRLIWGLDTRVEVVLRQMHDQQIAQQEAQLNELVSRLHDDPDNRTLKALCDLRKLYGVFQNKNFLKNYREVSENVSELFRACIKQLIRSCEMWESLQAMPTNVRDEILVDREKVIREILAAVDTIGKTVQDFHELTTDEGASELSRRRQELDTSLEVARRAEAEMAKFEGRKSEESEFLK